MMASAGFIEGGGLARIGTLVVCAAVGALGLACGVDAGSPSETGASDPAAAPDQATAPAALTACATAAAAGPWWNQAFAPQLGRFHAELDATPSANGIDAVVGLSTGAASGFAQLAVAVRFNPSGTIDARSGATYKADVTQPYVAGTSYHLRLDLDVRAHTYSVWLRSDFGGYTAIARDYAFRTEQAAATRLDNAASKVDSAAGAVQICGLQVVADATTADGCVVATAGDGFVTAALPDATVLDTLTFNARPSGPNLDAVIGLTAGAAASFSDLAAAVRLAPSGVIDVRDGDAYRADATRMYSTGDLPFRLIADLTSHTYSVFQGVPQGAQELARQYRFRTERGAITHLDHLAVIVDGTQGSVTVCQARATPSRGVAYSREGAGYTVLPLGDTGALISDGTTTRRVDARGQTLAQVARGGELAVDVLGNVFIASVSGNTLSIDKLDPSFAPRWHTDQVVLAGAVIRAISTDPTGAVLVGVVTPQEGSVTISRITAGGTLASQLSGVGEAVALDGDQAIVAWNDSGTLRITRFTANGVTLWTRGYTGSAGIGALAVDPGHNVLLGGELFTAIDFGGGTLPVVRTDNGPLNGFVVKLSQAGDHVFSRRTGYTTVGGIAANATRIAVSSTEQTQFHYEHLQLLDPAGAPVAGTGFDTGFGEFGFGGRVVMAASGRVWWSLETQWPLFPRWSYLVALTP